MFPSQCSKTIPSVLSESISGLESKTLMAPSAAVAAFEMSGAKEKTLPAEGEKR